MGGSAAPRAMPTMPPRARRMISIERNAPPTLTVATLPAIALLVVVHRTVLAGLFASRLVGGKSCRANHGRQNRKQDLSVIFHLINLVRDVVRC
jgi:hypothetical protein